MYQIDKSQNRIKPIMKKNFADLGFREREHLQEWLANEPTAFGEELLIIQKEFAGFDETNERIDLLALDTKGNLVIIENKLDDSGRDVVWQALKYASYCSTLEKQQIVEIYQQYLDKYDPGKNAQELICEFLGKPDLAEIVINSGNQQRVILVAAKFRLEVTSTVLWLLAHDIKLQCFKATPYAMDDNLFLTLEQIIPPPEAENYMIGISRKDAAEKTTEKEADARGRIRQEFWGKALEALRASKKTELFNNVSPGNDNYLATGSGISGCLYNLIFVIKEVRVELYIAQSNKAANKYIFDNLITQKTDIERSFGKELSWDRLDDKKSSYIRYGHAIDGYNPDNWPEIIEWMIDHIVKLETSLKKPLADAAQALKKAGIESVNVPGLPDYPGLPPRRT